MSVARRDGDDIGPNAEVGHGGRAHGGVADAHFDDVAAVDAEPCRRLRVQLDPGAPRDLRDGIGELDEPGLIRAAAESERRRWVDNKRVITPRCFDRRAAPGRSRRDGSGRNGA